jgi:hypothetical protein
MKWKNIHEAIETRPDIMFTLERLDANRFVLTVRDQTPRIVELPVGNTLDVTIPIVWEKKG